MPRIEIAGRLMEPAVALLLFVEREQEHAAFGRLTQRYFGENNILGQKKPSIESSRCLKETGVRQNRNPFALAAWGGELLWVCSRELAHRTEISDFGGSRPLHAVVEQLSRVSNSHRQW